MNKLKNTKVSLDIRFDVKVLVNDTCNIIQGVKSYHQTQETSLWLKCAPFAYVELDLREIYISEAGQGDLSTQKKEKLYRIELSNDSLTLLYLNNYL